MVGGYRGRASLALRAVADPSAEVRAAALGAARRAGCLKAHQHKAAFADPSPLVRRRAVELAAEQPDEALVPELETALGDPDALVVERACFALGELGDPRLAGALAAVASDHPDHRCREAAVGALGALGAPAGKDAVLGALGDRPAVRRRAAVALAAFEGADVEAALRRCLNDRDWQVRSVAEELLET